MPSSHPATTPGHAFSILTAVLDPRSGPRLAWLLVGALLARGRRTVTRWIRAAGLIDEYRRRLRFILDEHRQDLLPGQRASLINTLKERFKMNNKEVGAYLGVDASTIRTWLLVDSLIPDVVQEVDSGTVSLHSARSLEGTTAAGQEKVLAEHKELFQDRKNWSAHKLHRHLRET